MLPMLGHRPTGNNSDEHIYMYWLSVAEKGVKLPGTPNSCMPLLFFFRSEYEYEIEYKYDFLNLVDMF